MEIRTLESESSLVVNIKGLLDTSHARDLEKFLDSKIGNGYRKFLLDCTYLDSVSSGGIGFLIRLKSKMKSDPGLLFVFSEMNSEVLKILKFFRLDTQLEIFQKQTSAKEYLSRIPGKKKKEPSKNPDSIHSRTGDRKSEDSLSTVVVKRSPYKDKIQFYYKGQTPRVIRREEPVSRLEPISEDESINTTDLPRSEKFRSESESSSDSLLERLEERMEELKMAIQEKNEKEEDSRKKEWENRIRDLEKQNRENKEALNQFKEEASRSKPVEIRERIIEVKDRNSEPVSSASSAIEKEPDRVPIPKEGISHPPEKWESEVIPCESCGISLRVRKPGKYRCPHCFSEFLYKKRDFVSFFEKLT